LENIDLDRLNYREEMKRYFNGTQYGIRFSISDFNVNYQFSLVELIFVIKSDSYLDSLRSVLDDYKPIYLEYNPTPIVNQNSAILTFGHQDLITKQKIIDRLEINEGIEIDYYNLKSDFDFVEGLFSIGTYYLTITFYDTSRKSVIVNIKLEIIKQIKYSSGGIIFSDIDNPLSIKFIQSFITATDKEDGDITNNIMLVDNHSNYSENIKKLGSYELVFSVIDSRSNETRIQIEVRVVDITPPVISGKDHYTIFKNDGTILTTEIIRSNLLASDNYDDDITHAIEVSDDAYKNQYDKTGTYQLIFKVQDSSSNESSFRVIVTVIDDEYPELNFSGLIISVERGNKMTHAEIIFLINKHLELKQITAKDLKILENNYSGNENYPGVYHIKIGYINVINQFQIKDIRIIVLEETQTKNFFMKNKEILTTILSLTGLGVVGIIVRRKFLK